MAGVRNVMVGLGVCALALSSALALLSRRMIRRFTVCSSVRAPGAQNSLTTDYYPFWRRIRRGWSGRRIVVGRLPCDCRSRLRCG
jgi:hypothetical protein